MEITTCVEPNRYWRLEKKTRVVSNEVDPMVLLADIPRRVIDQPTSSLSRPFAAELKKLICRGIEEIEPKRQRGRRDRFTDQLNIFDCFRWADR